MANFWTLPVTVVGNVSLKTQYRGTLKYAIYIDLLLFLFFTLFFKIEITSFLQNSFNSASVI